MSRPVPFSIAGRCASAQPREPAFYQDPYAFYAALHAASPTFLWEEYDHRCFTGFREVNALLRDKRFGRQILHLMSREELGVSPPKPHTAAFDKTEKYSLLALEPPVHTRLRTLVNRAFVSRNVEQLRPRIQQLANELIDRFEDDGEAELLKAFAAPLPAIIIAEMIGLPAEMAPQLLDWSNRMVAMYMFGVTEAVEHDANQASVDFMDYLRTVIAERRRQPRDDLLTHMLTADPIDGQKLNEEEVISTAILLLNAGHEATVHTTGNGIKAILESGIDPKVLFATPEQTAATVEECLRYDAPLHMFTRYALEDTEVEGIAFRKGEVIGLMLAAANRDPTRFDEANAFNPFRTDGANVSFGAGIHFCIGAPLARIELQVALKTLFERLPGVRVAESPAYKNVYHFHGLDRLRVVW